MAKQRKDARGATKVQRELDRHAKQEKKLTKRREARDQPKPEPGETSAGEGPRKTEQGR